jgi:uncharacterized membrane-anchored protein
VRRALLITASLVFVLVAVGFATVQKEQLIRHGAVVLLELAPVDPRSLMQGDYMQLRYAIVDRDDSFESEKPTDGHYVLHVDAQRVASLVRIHDGQPLGRDELLLRYRGRDRMIRLGAEAFFFQEGHAERYANARYGELRVARDGESVLVGLRDAERRPIR